MMTDEAVLKLAREVNARRSPEIGELYRRGEFDTALVMKVAIAAIEADTERAAVHAHKVGEFGVAADFRAYHHLRSEK